MNIGILGTGGVAQTLGTKLVSLGHAVKLGSRTTGNEKATAWAAQAGPTASHGTFAEAADFGELLILATLGTGTLDAIALTGPDRLAGKTVIDLTNPLDVSQGMPPKLFVGHTDSLAEMVQRAAPQAHVVKALNIVSAAQMVDPTSTGSDLDMFIAGNDAAARQQVTDLLKSFGWKNITDFGGIESARFLEPLVLLWVHYGMKTGGWAHALKFVKQ
ncbi:NAD(P)-binding domain-containing protein [Hymenobacter sp. BT770]|uniref:NADPH-dependent F420 reductase n=1 Tax=Hymenobacter sp. BT770 TaxID=2886942 RepID=UPI001D0FA74E|nr:NAD(P)-binding domain-containing protein [Hymenobacter sp. BT770]MCC3153970.1 NAD(P)-binding domain-containing protein [Hymenobacter sp. BT770]MDO3416100.1 NAD(P)-binding domain-containing protein [Hymenobacter sp. BT770]